MKPVSRRQALALGIAGTGAIAVGGGGLLWARSSPFRPATGGRLEEPVILGSRERLLELLLEAAPAQVTVAGREASVAAYNKTLPGPTLRLRPGDRLRIALVNSLDTATNLHVHGLHVSPAGNGDNSFVSVEPGGSFDYEYGLPTNHPSGTFWYHPHHHGNVADQVAAGLYGAIIVDDPEDLPVTQDRVLLVSDISLTGTGALRAPSVAERMMGREGETVLVNGQVAPVLSAAFGDRERWRVINACPARYLRLHLEGGQLQILALDGRRLSAPAQVAEVLLAPGNRADLLVEAVKGTMILRAASYDRGTMSGMMGRGRAEVSGPVTLLSLDTSGVPGGVLPPVPSTGRIRDLRKEPVAAHRRFDFSMGMGPGMGPGGMRFTINDKAFDAGRIDETVSVGSVEEWTLSNGSPMDHPMHLHVWPMQVIQEGGRNLPDPKWQDVVNIPALDEVKVLVSFDDFPGRAVFHCHILDHEDQGMMGVVEAR
ncbi:multicopper oxidase family protein [Arthrobacter sulfonylureivorans]|uniref:Multicopper oxidase family protein n=1 Tax=Arthrobacter sulfonylureivorans TaxID=2486855 RepID=A0ABY3W7F3_9MICC|nr:multicopper oxidase family protein [Arthrobacter sulfonylureivorans]UNK44236.1 multicopper oxidase family protein [Arthrobacter sulfonylureivorans]